MRALIAVDIQNDFLPGGALAVPGGEAVVPVIDRILPCFRLAVATKDWHPPDHGSFAASHPGRRPGETILLAGLEQILWPVHCVQGTAGAAFAPHLDTTHFAAVFHKGVDRQVDSYSAFFDNAHRRSTGLDAYLRERGVDEIFLAGLATDYCVLYSARDAVHLGFATRVVGDGCRGIDLRPGDSTRALEEMERIGVEIVDSAHVVAAGAHA